MVYGTEGDKGLDIIDLHDPANPKRVYTWRIENQDLHLGTGGMDVKHFKWKDRYYVVQSLQFRQGGPDPDLGAVVLDVTELPDASTVKEVGRIREPDYPGGLPQHLHLQAQQRRRAARSRRSRDRSPTSTISAASSRATSRTRSSPRCPSRARKPSAAATTISTSGITPTAPRIASTAAARAATTSTTSRTSSSPSSS